MLLPEDLQLLEEKEITQKQIEQQLTLFQTGFPFLDIISAASIGNGIFKIQEKDQQKYLDTWNDYLASDVSVLKFVPASGAASRMFKDLFAFSEGKNSEPTTDFEKKFFKEIEHFAFFDELNKSCKKNLNKSISELIKYGNYKDIVDNLLFNSGLNYGSLPKGLLLFHTYPNGSRTPLEEHLVEGTLYAKNGKTVNIHFTVSPEHRQLFEQKLKEKQAEYEKEFDANYQVTFSAQKSSTDTIATDTENKPFRDSNGTLVFRPGGHGALIQNLNDLSGDVIFIKNIDNVIPDRLKDSTITYKKILGGVLVHIQKMIFAYLKELENAQISEEELKEILQLTEEKLNIFHPDIEQMEREQLRKFLIEKLNRPIRVCGMVINEGEPGGGPFNTVNQDGTISPQILESSQINKQDPVEEEKMMKATHFNPVDLVCGVKNYKGEPFDLLEYVDPNTGFISSKSKNGKELKALELPGLWNGAMSDWNTIFIEVPIDTFNPVKNVNDLLRDEHQ